MFYGWFLYLFGYEFLFRGVLLIPLIDPLGMWPAIAINIAVYSATHIPKGRRNYRSHLWWICLWFINNIIRNNLDLFIVHVLLWLGPIHLQH